MRGIKIISGLVGAAGFIAVAAGFAAPSSAPGSRSLILLLGGGGGDGGGIPRLGGVASALASLEDDFLCFLIYTTRGTHSVVIVRLRCRASNRHPGN